MSSKDKRPVRKFVRLKKKKIDKEPEKVPSKNVEDESSDSEDVFTEQNINSNSTDEIESFDDVLNKDSLTNMAQNPNEVMSEAFQETTSLDSEKYQNYDSDSPGLTENFVNHSENIDSDNLSNDSDTKAEKTHELVIDPEMPYFFVFGLPSSGKTVMLSGLLYYIKTLANGQLKTLNSTDKINHKKGQYIMSQMQKCVRSGQFVTGTKAIDKTEFVFPNEINLEFIPDELNKPLMPFCLLDMAGEDQKSVMFGDEGLSGGELDERISAYLEHPSCSLVFIFAIDVDFPDKSEDLIDRFLDYVESLGHTNNPVLFTVNKWDTQCQDYDSVEDYFEQNLRILDRRRKDPKRFTAILDFSIGKVRYDDSKSVETYAYDPKDSERLMKWMYKISTGFDVDEEIPESNLKRLFKGIKKRLKNG